MSLLSPELLQVPSTAVQPVQSYLPLYRKYRPNTLADLVGQSVIQQALGNAIALGKVAHAYLFCGPRGTGKTSTARILAKSLNCAQGPTITPCGTCPSCEGMAAGHATDVIEFDAASHNGVEQARELIESTQYAPIAGRYKIYIIDEVHMLTPQAFNTLLKTLEEPPPNVIFVFATTEAHKVLPTIISRCQRFDFQRVTSTDLVARLEHIAEQEGILLTPEVLYLIARKAKGGLRDAVGMLDQLSVLALAEPGKPLDLQTAGAFLGVLDEAMLAQLLRQLIAQAPQQVLELIQNAARSAADPYQVLAGLVAIARALLWQLSMHKTLTTAADAAKVLDVLPETAETLLQLASTTPPALVTALLSRLNQAERDMRQGQDAWLWLEVALMDIAYRQDLPILQELAERLEKLEAGGVAVAHTPQLATPAMPTASAPMAATLSQAPAQSTVKSSPVPAAQPLKPATPMPAPAKAQTPANMPAPAMAQAPASTDDWQAFLLKIGSGMTRALVKDHAALSEMDDASLTLIVKSQPLAEKLMLDQHKIHVEAAAKAVYGRALTLKVIVGERPATPPSSTLSPSPTSTSLSAEPEPVNSAPAQPKAQVPPPPASSQSLTPATAATPDTTLPTLAPQAPALPPLINDTEADRAETGHLETSITIDEARQYTIELLQGTVIE
ncbi:MAG: DNA polymerase III subunit gamma/tau [Vampirovibrionales bacterium]|nr:DNA polymerase III subunit gamma/tau [Vampirovibrionales bacterium]